MAQDKLIFLKKWSESIEELPDKARLEIYDAVMRYAFKGEESQFTSRLTAMAFKFIQADIESDSLRRTDIAEKRRSAGKRGGAPKNNKNARKGDHPETPTQSTVSDAPVNATLIDDITDQPDAQKPEKPKRPPKKHYAPEVLMTEDEYNKLVTQYGSDGAQWMIQKLDDYKAARGTKYKSDYRAILNWVVREYQRQSYGTTTTNRLSDREIERQQRGVEYAQYIKDTLDDSSSHGLP